MSWLVVCSKDNAEKYIILSCKTYKKWGARFVGKLPVRRFWSLRFRKVTVGLMVQR